jgi:glutathione S-transferase
LDVLEAHLDGRDWVVGERMTIADAGLFPYISVAPVDLDEWPRVSLWLERIRALPGFVDDFIVYPENARAGAGASIYA